MIYYKLNKIVKAILLLAFIIFSNITHAEFNLKEYEKLKKEMKDFDIYLYGIGKGIFWSNVMLYTRDKKRLFCLPESLALDKGIILSIIDQEINNPSFDNKYKNDDSIEMIAVVAFMNKFPCK